MIDKRDLRIGNMFEQGIVWKISGRSGAKVHLHGKGKWYKGFRSEVAVENLKPIILTPSILVDWCGFERDNHDMFNYHKEDFTLYVYGTKLPVEQQEYRVHCCGKEVVISYLHELQNIWRVSNKQELEIKG